MKTKTGHDEIELQRMYWHSRRGMLELDLILVPFASEQLADLDADWQEKYRLLLEQEDQDLFLWLTGRAEAPGQELQEIIGLILQKRNR